MLIALYPHKTSMSMGLPFLGFSLSSVSVTLVCNYHKEAAASTIMMFVQQPLFQTHPLSRLRPIAFSRQPDSGLRLHSVSESCFALR